MNPLDATIRKCESLGLHALDFPVSTCHFATPFCLANCYNCKMYRMYGQDMHSRDSRNLAAWETSTSADWRNWLDRRKKPIKRFRIATRGEALHSIESVERMAAIARACPEVTWWIPTRAWRSPLLRSVIDATLRVLPNVRVMASLDPSNTPEQVESLNRDGWSTMFFGNDAETSGRTLCPKTHKHEHAACASCQRGCFSKRQVHIHLKQH